MKTATNREPITSAQAAISSSIASAAIVIVTSTKSEEASLTRRALQLAHHDQRALRSQRAAHAFPGEEIEIGIQRAGHRRHRQAEGGADGLFTDQQAERPDDDPDGAAQHRGADHAVGDLFEFAGTEFELGKLAAMEPPHDDQREDFDHAHQGAADRLRQDGQGAAEDSGQHEHDQDAAIGDDSELYRALLGLLLGRDARISCHVRPKAAAGPA
jgi:hypothetical protein